MAHQYIQGDNEQEIWKKFREGDTVVFEYIYREYISGLSGYGRRLSPDEELIKDSIHDLFVDLWKNRATLGPTDSIKYYLVKAFRRNLIKKMQAGRRSVPIQPNPQQFELSCEFRLIEMEQKTERESQLRKQLQQLTSRQREVIYLRFYEDLSYVQIAEILGINPQSACNTVFRTLERLRDRMTYSLPLIAFLIMVLKFF